MPDGRLIFCTLNLNSEIWSVPVDGNKGKILGQMKRLTNNPTSDVAFDLSRDGNELLFLSNRSGNDDVWLKDLESGKETPQRVVLLAWNYIDMALKMTADGSHVSLRSPREEQRDKEVIYQLPTKGPQKACEDCADFGSGHWMERPSFIGYHQDRKKSVGSFNLKTGKRTGTAETPQLWYWLGPVLPDTAGLPLPLLSGLAGGHLVTCSWFPFKAKKS
jgi:Tol biopolymer transport system component